MAAFFSALFTRLKQNWQSILLFSALFGCFYVIALFIPEGFDWQIFFGRGVVPALWTPWAVVVVRFLTFPLLVAITLTSLVVRAFRYNRSPLPAILAIVSLPTYWVIHLGNLDGLVLAGLILLPIGAPLVLLKPQLAAFSLLAKKSSFTAGVIWVVISLLIWGLWPLNFLAVSNQGWSTEWVQDITLFPWGAIVALPLLWLSRGDEDMLMAAGSFVTPHLFPYHFILVMPALARMKLGWMLAAWLLSWSPLLANWLGDEAWHFGNLFALVLWAGIYFGKKTKQNPPVQSTTS